MHPILLRKLTDVLDARRLVRQSWGNAWLLGLVGAAAVVLWWSRSIGRANFSVAFLGFAAVLIVGLLIVRWWSARLKMDVQAIAREIEATHPDLRVALLTALEQRPGAQGLSYMQEQVIHTAVQKAVRQHWGEALTERSLQRAAGARVAAAALLVMGLSLIMHRSFFERTAKAKPTVAKAAEKAKPSPDYEVNVTPGDTEVEQGARVVVEAKFTGAVPADATLVLTNAQGQELSRTAMRSTVDTQVFGAMSAAVKEDGRYRVEFGEEHSRDFELKTFLYPELLRADVTITPPAYAKQPAREVKNTFKVTALEGSSLAWRMKVNKPVKHAELFADKEHVIPLTTDPKDTTTLLAAFQPDTTRKYRLQLIDDRERANKQPPWFHITVLANQLPKIDIAFPQRDAKVSTLEEVALEAKLWDDTGVQKAGTVIDLPTGERSIDLAVADTAPAKKLNVKHLLKLEHDPVQPTQLISYYFWAEDKGPQGETRRVMSDMFFAEVRPFEDLYREAEAPPPSDEEKEQATKLEKLQKEIVNATWRLIRDAQGGKKMADLKADIGTVAASQAINDANVTEAIAKAETAKAKKLLGTAQAEMKKALEKLGSAADNLTAKDLTDARVPEQAALRALYELQSNEHSVVKANPRSKSQKAENDERELNNLELKQQDQRYEEEKEAQKEKTVAQQENLQVLSRLKELARRQEALAEKMKELQQQLAEAKTEEQKQELAQQMKRLQDEQDQLLRDLDDLRNRMEQSKNADSMADAKKQLDETREKVNDTLEQMKEQQLAQATNSATKAKQQLEETRDDFRQRTAKRFSEEVKQLRDEARELDKAQQKLAQSLEDKPKGNDGKGKEAADSLKQGLAAAQQSREIEAQRDRAKKLNESMKQLSEQAEGTEPLLHKHLYEALRSAASNGLEEAFDETSRQVRYGDQDGAQNAERQASKAVTALKEGAEKAAESVLGNESDALRMARKELDQLIQQAQASAETPGAKPGEKPAEKPGEKSGAKPGKGDRTDPSDQTDPAGKATASAEKPGDKPGSQPGKGDPSDPSDQTDPSSQSTASAGQPGEKPSEKPGKPNQDSGINNQKSPPWFFDTPAEAQDTTALTGTGFEQWTDRLRSVEEMLSQPELRDAAASVLDHARNERLTQGERRGAPEVANLGLRVLKPLIELRDRVAEELAQREGKNPLAPIDRDPVPEAFREGVRKYYEQLSAGK